MNHDWHTPMNASLIIHCIFYFRITGALHTSQLNDVTADTLSMIYPVCIIIICDNINNKIIFNFKLLSLLIIFLIFQILYYRSLIQSFIFNEEHILPKLIFN
jgi:branched-subunit amino acid permease